MDDGAQILIPFSLAGVGALLNLTEHNYQSLTTVFMTSLVSSLILLGWLKIAVRWHGYQTIAQYRMLEIERDLGMWCIRYELEAPAMLAPCTDAQEITKKEEDLDRLRRVPTEIIRKGKSTIIVIRHVVFVLVLSWAFLSIREVLLAYGCF